jgi:hypothetical protein
MKKIVAILLSTLTTAIVPSSAAADQLHANVASWSPNDVRPGEPVSLVLYLYTPSPTAWAPDGRRFAGVNDVEVVLRGQGQTRRFATEDLGGGRYGAEISFPQAGAWAVRVSYGPGRDGVGDEVPLGKGGVCVAADCVAPQPGETTFVQSDGWPWTTIALIFAAGLAVALVVAAVTRTKAGRLGRRGAARTA